jgi:hypothetical protein
MRAPDVTVEFKLFDPPSRSCMQMPPQRLDEGVHILAGGFAVADASANRILAFEARG